MSSSTLPNHYEALGLTESATQEEIKGAYRRRALELHPDKNLDEDTTEAFQRIGAAYETLYDPDKRRRYDARRSGIAVSESYSDSDVESNDDGGLAEMIWMMFQAAAAQRLAREAEERALKEAEAERKKAREEAKKKAEEKAEERAVVLKKLRFDAEVTMQIQRWAAKSVTPDMKKKYIDMCFHSMASEKTKHPRKVKCDDCGKKRGTMSFKCPHCKVDVCQMCNSKDAKRRDQEVQKEVQKMLRESKED